MLIQVNNSGFTEQIEIAVQEIEQTHLPLLARFRQTAGERRSIVLIAGPPGSGKGVLCELWRVLAEQQGLSYAVVSLDGFHFPNNYLAERDLLERKGAPDTFDVRSMTIALAQARAGTSLVWPVYDRNLHEPVAEGVRIADQQVIVVEGNYLLLDEPHWATLRRYATLTVSVKVDHQTLRERVIARHVRGGMSRKDAEDKFVSSDFKNIIRVEERSVAGDVVLLRGHNGQLVLLVGGERSL